jgi:hypothetical protein
MQILTFHSNPFGCEWNIPVQVNFNKLPRAVAESCRYAARGLWFGYIRGGAVLFDGPACSRATRETSVPVLEQIQPRNHSNEIQLIPTASIGECGS